MEKREDQVEKYFLPIAICDKWTGVFFWLCALLSLVVPYKEILPAGVLQQVPSILFLISVFIHFVLSCFSGFYLIPRAENLRRQQLLSDSFDVHLIPETTSGYYNNNVFPSVIRLGASILENTFFAKKVCLEMAKIERVKVLIYFILWLAAISCRNTELGVLLAITQAIFSGGILVRLIKIETLRHKSESIYNDVYSLFLDGNFSENISSTARLLYAFASYESAKASAAVKQNSKIFYKLNSELSKEWNNIKDKLKIDMLKGEEK